MDNPADLDRVDDSAMKLVSTGALHVTKLQKLPKKLFTVIRLLKIVKKIGASQVWTTSVATPICLPVFLVPYSPAYSQAPKF